MAASHGVDPDGWMVIFNELPGSPAGSAAAAHTLRVVKHYH
ncbi:hypothetical protein AB0L65_10285 [Nonomuraea sp. NPDC052116]